MSGRREYGGERAEAGTGMNRNKPELNRKSTTLLTGTRLGPASLSQLAQCEFAYGAFGIVTPSVGHDHFIPLLFSFSLLLPHVRSHRVTLLSYPRYTCIAISPARSRR
jgi:hypothetical protein